MFVARVNSYIQIDIEGWHDFGKTGRYPNLFYIRVADDVKENYLSSTKYVYIPRNAIQHITLTEFKAIPNCSILEIRTIHGCCYKFDGEDSKVYLLKNCLMDAL